MKFYDLHKSIANSFDSSKDIIETPEGIDIHLISYTSGSDPLDSISISIDKIRQTVNGGSTDASIDQNKNFQYLVFAARGIKNDKAILLLHGLNERRWDKYYTWGHKLAKDTGKSVILIPFSFHLNRGLPDWIDRHLLTEKTKERKSKYLEDEKLITFFNHTLSNRLTESPERFFISGLQTANDMVSILTDIRKGNHPLFKANTQTDIFAYSIGGLLGQVLYISNPENLFDHSKLFLFCAGSLFKDMNGISKVIMDPPAFKRIYKYYTTELNEIIEKSGAIAEFFNKSKIGTAFRSMLGPDQLKSVREKIFKNKSRQIFALALKKDKVIPPEKIRETLFGNRKANMEVLDFDFPYSHEIPFPMRLDKIRDKIDDAFERVFFRAGVFLS